MPQFTIHVLPDGEDKPHVWTIQASTEDDAMQLAFALDGGWSLVDRDASDLLELAKAYCSVWHKNKLSGGGAMENMKDKQQPEHPPSTPAAGSALFVIQRPEDFAEWFAGWNAWGPIWTSDYSQAAEVRADLIVSYMEQLAKHKPCASLLPNTKLGGGGATEQRQQTERTPRRPLK